MKSKFTDCLEKAKANENESSVNFAERTLLSENEAGRVFSRVKSNLLSVEH